MTPGRPFALLAVVATLLAFAPAASAASLVGKPLQKSIWGPVEVNGVSQFPVYRQMGVKLFQIQLRWDSTARSARPADPANPADPAYRWPADVDLAVQEAQRHGIKVLLLVQGVPGWANGSEEWRVAPRDVRDYTAFLTAAARRYPNVRHWMIWGEPVRNLVVRGNDRSRAGWRRHARFYARLLDGGYRALKRASNRNVVIGGNTYPSYHHPTEGAPVSLYEWIRMLRLPKGRVPRMDSWGHNPYTPQYPRLNAPSLVHGEFSDLDLVLATLHHVIARPLRRRRMPLFLSEFCLPTGPNPYFNLELSMEKQARWLGSAMRTARSLPEIWGFGWWRLEDDPAALDPAASANRCGLVDGAFRPKPAFHTFRRAKTSRRRR